VRSSILSSLFSSTAVVFSKSISFHERFVTILSIRVDLVPTAEMPWHLRMAFSLNTVNCCTLLFWLDVHLKFGIDVNAASDNDDNDEEDDKDDNDDDAEDDKVDNDDDDAADDNVGDNNDDAEDDKDDNDDNAEDDKGDTGSSECFG